MPETYAFMDTIKYFWAQIKKGNNAFIQKTVTKESRILYFVKCVSNRIKKIMSNEFKAIDTMPDVYRNKKKSQSNFEKIENSDSYDLLQKAFSVLKDNMEKSSPAQREILHHCSKILELIFKFPDKYLKGNCNLNIKKISLYLGISRPAVCASGKHG